MKSWRLNDRVGLVADKLNSVSPSIVRLDPDSFTEPERQLFRKISEINEKYGSSPPFDVLQANMDFINKAWEIVFLRTLDLFMLVMRELAGNSEIEEWFLKLHFHNFLVDFSECISNVRKWSEQDRDEFLRDMKENGWQDKVFRIPRDSRRLNGATNDGSMATFLQLLKETGIRSGEAWQLTHNDIDTVTQTIRITAEKNSNPRIFHISQKLAAMLENLPQTSDEELFSGQSKSLNHHRDGYNQQRKRISNKLKNPRLLRITFHTLRHFKGTMEYHRTKDILHVMQVLGHKSIKNTLLYVQLAEELFKDQQEYISKVAKTPKDACSLIEAGFEYVCDVDDAKIFRKRKY